MIYVQIVWVFLLANWILGGSYMVGAMLEKVKDGPIDQIWKHRSFAFAMAGVILAVTGKWIM